MSKDDSTEDVMPSQVSDKVSWFDHFATRSANLVSKAWFFAFCVLMVAVWFPTLFFMPLDMSQLIINTATTIITFLMVALLENTSTRADAAVQHKLNAIAEALAVVMEDSDNEHEADELRAAVGLEKREST
jgi:low affinity Fe/Cu permease